MDAIILSAGKGTRLHPITKTIPKPLFPIAGRHLLCHILDALENSVNRVIIVIGYKADQIRQTIEAMNYPFEIAWIIQHEQKGTGHALQICRDQIKSSRIFMMYGDIFTNPQTIKSIINQSREINEKNGLFAAKKVEKPEKYGGLEIENDLLVSIHEKDPNPPSKYINPGIMILPFSIFDSLATTPKSIRGEIEITDSINKLVNQGVQLHIHYIEDYWVDTGHPWDLVTANELGMQNLQIAKEFSPPEGVTVEGPVSISKSSILRPGTFIQGPIVIKDNVTVGPNCYIRPGTYLGKNVRIGNAVELKNSIILENTTIGHLSYVGDSIIGKNSNFGAGTKVANLKLDKSEIKMTINGKKLPTGRRKMGTILGENVTTGINVSIMPGVIIGENSRIGAHTLVYKNIPPDTLFYHDPSKGIIQKKM